MKFKSRYWETRVERRPRKGAWIEMGLVPTRDFACKGRPRKGAWIEICPTCL